MQLVRCFHLSCVARATASNVSPDGQADKADRHTNFHYGNDGSRKGGWSIRSAGFFETGGSWVWLVFFRVFVLFVLSSFQIILWIYGCCMILFLQCVGLGRRYTILCNMWNSQQLIKKFPTACLVCVFLLGFAVAACHADLRSHEATQRISKKLKWAMFCCFFQIEGHPSPLQLNQKYENCLKVEGW